EGPVQELRFPIERGVTNVSLHEPSPLCLIGRSLLYRCHQDQLCGAKILDRGVHGLGEDDINPPPAVQWPPLTAAVTGFGRVTVRASVQIPAPLRDPRVGRARWWRYRDVSSI